MAEKNPVLKYELDPEDIITDRILLRQMIERQEALEQFIKDHMEAEEEKFEQIKRYLMLLAGLMLAVASGMDVASIVSTLLGFL